MALPLHLKRSDPPQVWTYEQFLGHMRSRWRQGQHIALIAPTGGGKTYAALDLISIRKHVVAIATKAKDETLDTYPFVRKSDWPPDYGEHRILYWVKPRVLGDFSTQRQAIRLVMQDLYKRGGWAIYFDDVNYVANTLGLRSELQMFYTQVRSNHVSIIAAQQRPSIRLLEALSQSSYILLFRVHDKIDRDRVAGEVGIDRKQLEALNAQLADFEFLLIQHGRTPILVHRKEV